MNKKRTLKLKFLSVLAIASAVFALAGCSPRGDTIRDVIDRFIAAVNAGDAAGVRATLDPAAASYNTANTAFWNTHFPNRPYSISSFSTSGNAATVTFTGTGGLTHNHRFEMTEVKGTLFEGGTYHIRTIGNVGGAIFFE